MDFKEKIKEDIKKKETKEIWEKIYQGFEKGSTEEVKNTLNEYLENISDEYAASIEKLKKLLWL